MMVFLCLPHRHVVTVWCAHVDDLNLYIQRNGTQGTVPKRITSDAPHPHLDYIRIRDAGLQADAMLG